MESWGTCIKNELARKIHGLHQHLRQLGDPPYWAKDHRHKHSRLRCHLFLRHLSGEELRGGDGVLHLCGRVLCNLARLLACVLLMPQVVEAGTHRSRPLGVGTWLP